MSPKSSLSGGRGESTRWWCLYQDLVDMQIACGPICDVLGAGYICEEQPSQGPWQEWTEEKWGGNHFGIGEIFASLKIEGTVLVRRLLLNSVVTAGDRIAAKSRRTQNCIPSGPQLLRLSWRSIADTSVTVTAGIPPGSRFVEGGWNLVDSEGKINFR